ncbi:MAG: ABC transporter permease [Solirubrobacterales bacterium]
MTVAIAYANAAKEVVRRDFLVFITYRARVITQLLSGFLALALFYYVSRLVRVSTFESPDAYFAFVMVGILIIRTLASTFTAASAGIRQQLVAGTFERTVVSPFGPVGGIAAQLVFPFLLAAVLSTVMLLIAAAVFGIHLEWATLPLALPVGALAALCFAPFALMLAAAALLFKQTAAGAGFVLTAISLVAGFYFPISVLPEWIQWMSEVQPFTPAVELLRNVLVGTPLEDPALLSVLKMVGFAAVLLPFSYWVLKKAILIGRRRATIIEY